MIALVRPVPSTKPEIVIAAQSPFPVEVMVFEEDTYQVLSAGNHIREIREPLEELEHGAALQRPSTPGDIITTGSKWFDIVHDFDRENSYEPGYVDSALSNLALQISKAQVRSPGLQALEHYQGPEGIADVIAKIEALKWPDCLERIWLIVRQASQ